MHELPYQKLIDLKFFKRGKRNGIGETSSFRRYSEIKMSSTFTLCIYFKRTNPTTIGHTQGLCTVHHVNKSIPAHAGFVPHLGSWVASRCFAVSNLAFMDNTVKIAFSKFFKIFSPSL